MLMSISSVAVAAVRRSGKSPEHPVQSADLLTSTKAREESRVFFYLTMVDCAGLSRYDQNL